MHLIRVLTLAGALALLAGAGQALAGDGGDALRPGASAHLLDDAPACRTPRTFEHLARIVATRRGDVARLLRAASRRGECVLLGRGTRIVIGDAAGRDPVPFHVAGRTQVFYAYREDIAAD